MSHKFVCISVLLLLVALSLLPMSEAQDTSQMTISMAGMAEDSNVVVAGVIHNVTVTPSQASEDVVIRAYLSSGFAIGNSTNNYSWSYLSGVWADDLYGYYLKDVSARYGNSYCFHLAVDSLAVPGAWQFVTYIDGVESASRTIHVEAPVAGISMSAPTFYFNVVPFGTGYISSWDPNNASTSQYMTTRNTGNVPMTPGITFERTSPFGTSSSFIASNSTDVWLPGESRTHFIDFQAQSWSPRKFTIKGYVSGEPQVLMTPNTVSTIIAPRTTFDIEVTVARPGYDVFMMDGVTVQYKRYYYSVYKESFSMDMYLTGNKSVYMDQEMQNLTFNHFTNQGQNNKGEILLSLNDNVEQHVVANVTCSSLPPWKQPSMIAYAHFDLRLSDGSDTGRFTNNVVVKTSAEAETGIPISANMVVILVIAIVFLVIGLIVFRAYRKTEEEKRRELEERIRRKKERAKKQRRR